MTNNHPHIATPYEIEALAQRRLKAIVLPVNPEDAPSSEYFNCRESDLRTPSGGTWFRCDRVDGAKGGYKFLVPWRHGDRIYLQEEWDEVPVNFGEDVKPILKSIYPWWTDEWRSASTMPMEAAQHWFEIGGVRGAQMGRLLIENYEDAGFAAYSGDLIQYHQRIDDQWNAAYPEQPWHSDRWVIVLDINPNPEPQSLQP